MTSTPTRPLPSRLPPPSLPDGEVAVRPPPELPQSDSLLQGLALSALPMVGSLGSVAFVATSGHGSPQSYVAAGMFLLASSGFVAANLWRTRSGGRARLRAVRRDYHAYLGRLRVQVRAAAHEQRRHLAWVHPAPSALAAMVHDGTRVWERDAADADWLVVRWGEGQRPAALVLHLPEADGGEGVDPVCDDAVRRLVEVHAHVHDLPYVVALQSVGLLEVIGRPAEARGLARAVIAQATTFHPPDHLVVAVFTRESLVQRWDWVKWLPHATSDRAYDAAGGRRLVAATIDELAELLPADLAGRAPFGPLGNGRTTGAAHVLLVVDGPPFPGEHPLLSEAGHEGLTVMHLVTDDSDGSDDTRRGAVETRAAPSLRLTLAAARRGDLTTNVVATTAEGVVSHGDGDLLSLVGAEATARRLLGVWSARTRAGASGAVRSSQLTDLLGLADLGALDPAVAWRRRTPRDLLRIPVGTGPAGEIVHLDLKESAQHGAGPHGLLIGATGSGKSELLRTLVLGLALTHSPEVLNLVLVDFKGGATFAGMSRLPHVSAMITNLSEELTLVDRMHDALSGELTRRQEVLRAAGGYGSLRDYERARTSGEAPQLPALPSLLVVCDEFSELLSAKPELIDLFVAIGRLGRSLGVHLLLASQRLEEGRLRGLDSHLSYRVALRTFSAAESRAVIGVPDAHELPATPGLGLLRDDPTRLTPFSAAYVSGPASVSGAAPVGRAAGGPVAASQSGTGSSSGWVETDGRRVDVDVSARAATAILPFATGLVTAPPGHPDAGCEDRHRQPRAATSPGAVTAEQPSVLDVAVAALAGHGPAAHRIWLPPLDTADTLDGVLTDLEVDPALGLVSHRTRARGLMRVPLGTLDRPREQRREVLWADLSGADGHVAVVGGPRSGRSTVLRTVSLGLALTHTPREIALYVLDFGGGTFEALRDLPHTAGVGTRTEPDVVSRIIAEVTAIMDDREEFFRAHGVDGIETYRSRRGAGELDDGRGDVVLVVDGWGALRTELPDLEPQVQALAQRGLTYGVHLVTSATRWMDYRASLRDVLGTRLELRLGDPMDSEVDRRLAAAVPTGRPGRGLGSTGHHFLAALPRADGDPDGATLAAGVADLVARVRAGWTGPAAPRLRLLPSSIALQTIRDLVPTGPAIRTPNLPTGSNGSNGSNGSTSRTRGKLLLGISERDLSPVALDLDQDPHLLVVGEGRSGKSAALRTYLHEVARLHTPDSAQVFLVDYRRSHLGELPEEWVADCATTAEGASALARDLAAFLRERLPGPDVGAAQLRSRSWWQGREAFVVVDDYELVATGAANPLDPLVPLLARAVDIGLHLVVARRSGGIGRVHDGLLNQLRDLAQPGLLLSGDPAEGPLLGNHRAVPAPPGRGRLVTRDGVGVVQVAWSASASEYS